MKHLKLFENFEVVKPIIFGDPLNYKEIKFLEGYNIPCPEFILKDDNYYYVHDHRCEKIKDVPLTYIHGVCSKLNIVNYKINEDFSIDVSGNVFRSTLLSKIAIKFNNVTKSFWCEDSNLTSLKGSPKWVGGDFRCYSNQLITLEGGPEWVDGDFSCSKNKLTTLEGGPEYVGGYFYCYNNPLESTEYKGTIKMGLITYH
jgi:hypothetical protein